jgi:hypothetical protein
MRAGYFVFRVAVRVVAGGVVAALIGLAVVSCEQRALVTVDVRGDRPYAGVALQLSVDGGGTKTFTGASFDATLPYRAGLFLSGDPAAARITATVLVGGCVVASGSASAPAVAAGGTVGPVEVFVTTMAPACAADGGPDGARDGSSDHPGAGSGGAAGGSGAGGGPSGAGGAPGTGGAVTGTGGAGAGGSIAGTGGIGAGGRIAGTGGTGTGGRLSGTGGVGTGGRVSGTGGAGTGGAGTGGAPCSANLGKSCGNCAGAILCDGSCSRADTSCAPTGANHQLRNKGLMAGSTDLVMDIYSGDPFNAFMDTPCCSGSLWTITALGGGTYGIYSQAFIDTSGHAMALQSYADGSALQLGIVAGTTPSAAQTWTITALGAGYFRLTNALLGPDRSVVSDVNATAPRMAPTSTDASQYWLLSQ